MILKSVLVLVFILLFLFLWWFCSKKSIEFLKKNFVEYKGKAELKLLFFVCLSPLSILTFPFWILFVLKLLFYDIVFDYFVQKINELKKDIW